jgi:hypothetical protein
MLRVGTDGSPHALRERRHGRLHPVDDHRNERRQLSIIDILVPTLRVGTPLLMLCVSCVEAAYVQSTITGTSAGNFP